MKEPPASKRGLRRVSELDYNFSTRKGMSSVQDVGTRVRDTASSRRQLFTQPELLCKFANSSYCLCLCSRKTAALRG